MISQTLIVRPERRYVMKHTSSAPRDANEAGRSAGPSIRAANVLAEVL